MLKINRSITAVGLIGLFGASLAHAETVITDPDTGETAVMRDTDMTGSLDPSRISEDDRSVWDEEEYGDLTVPPVYQRPLGVDEGPRVHVTRFEIDGVVEHPEIGITRAKVESLIERLRQERQGINMINDEGFNPEEMADFAKFLREAISNPDKETNKEEFAQWMEQMREEKKLREGLTIGQIQEIAAEVTNLYRKAGMIVAQAYVPAQEVADGVVKITVAEGTFGRIVVEDNEFYSLETLQKPFAKLEKNAVDKAELESALFRLTDYPGLSAFGIMQSGENVGETDLLIKVQQERRRQYSVRADNHGAESTGEYRLKFNYDRYNPAGNADIFNFNLLASFDPMNTLYGGFSYKSQVFSSSFFLGAGYSLNQFEVGGELKKFQISGTAENTNVFMEHKYQRGRASNQYWKLELAKKVSETKLRDVPLNKDVLAVAALEWGFDILDSEYAGINQGTIKYSHGFPDTLGSLGDDDPNSSRTDARVTGVNSGEQEYAGGEFDKLTLGVSRFQSISSRQNMLFRLNAQYTYDLLVALEQSSLGGPNSVRAYPPSEHLRDNSVFASIDWNFSAPGFADLPAFNNRVWGEILQVSLFYDYAMGTLVDETDTLGSLSGGEESGFHERNTLHGGGVGVQLNMPGEIFAKLQIATPGGAAIPSNDRDPQYYFQLEYYF